MKANSPALERNDSQDFHGACGKAGSSSAVARKEGDAAAALNAASRKLEAVYEARISRTLP